jgi:hypothetical protein
MFDSLGALLVGVFYWDIIRITVAMTKTPTDSRTDCTVITSLLAFSHKLGTQFQGVMREAQGG